MSKAIVITAHGKLDEKNSTKLPINLITSCKFGELHASKHIKFSEISIFSNINFLYEYLFHGDDYSTRGELIYKNTEFPNILLSPLDPKQPQKAWSWQKPYVENHFRKMCIYELKDIPGNKYTINSTTINNTSLMDIKNEAQKIDFIPLKNHYEILSTYLSKTEYFDATKVNINKHLCSLTISDKSVYVFDYEMGSDNWSISDAITDIGKFCNDNSIDLTGLDSVVLKSCLTT